MIHYYSNPKQVHRKTVQLVRCQTQSKLIELFEHAYGDYCSKLSVAALTQKRTASNAASHEIYKLRVTTFHSFCLRLLIDYKQYLNFSYKHRHTLFFFRLKYAKPKEIR